MPEARTVDHVKSICSWDMFLQKDPGRFHSSTVSRVFQNYFNFVPKLESRHLDHIKVIVRETCFWKQILADFTFSSVSQIYSSFVPMLESRNMEHVKSICSWDMFLWKNSGSIHIFISLSKIFQLCTHARITKYGSREKYLFVRHVFVKRFWRTSQFHELFKNILILYLY